MTWTCDAYRGRIQTVRRLLLDLQQDMYNADLVGAATGEISPLDPWEAYRMLRAQNLIEDAQILVERADDAIKEGRLG